MVLYLQNRKIFGNRQVSTLYKKMVSALYVMNIMMQAIVTLLIPVGLMFLIAWLLVSKAELPEWIYAIFIPVGVISGFFSMIKFAIRSSEALERLEKQRDGKPADQGKKDNKE